MLRSSYFMYLLLAALPLAIIHAQDDQSGFISIDCGIAQGTNYTDSKTGLKGLSMFRGNAAKLRLHRKWRNSENDLPDISNSHPEYLSESNYTTLTSFPQRHSETVILSADRKTRGKGNRYLIRARSVIMELSLISEGLGTPFISALELRILDSSMYATQLQSLILYDRSNFGASETVRYGDDKYDRIWYTTTSGSLVDLQTSGTVSNLGSSTTNEVPSKVMSTALTSRNITRDIYYPWTATDAAQKFFIYLYIAEIETLKSNQKREFDIYLNDVYWDGPVSPLDHTTTTYLIQSSKSLVNNNITLYHTDNSTLPPLFNAIEVYIPKQLRQQQTEDQDAEAIWSTKSTYGLKRNWQGDPCFPQSSVWVGINCSYSDTENPRITSLNLSSSGLSGEIADSLANLTMIRSLDLSNNNLTGNVPKFLASYSSLEMLNLTGNNFARPLPSELLQKSKDRSLLLIIEGISDQDEGSCLKDSCKKKTHSKVVIPVIATIAAVIVLITILAIIWIIKRRKPQGLEYVQREPGDIIESRNQRFTFLEIQSITNSFNTVIGKGGFGTVFYGSLGDKQVAVKMLSESSSQGYKEFQAEVRLLMSVHHKNITSLVGYCDEGIQKGIIYEYMANGNLGMHLFDGSLNVLSWKKRLEIGYDAAQGLEYMHHGCKPPLVHRDVKCSNILLNETLQAKLADFGLSRAFSTEGATHVSTAIAGTPGYLDPEYYTTNRLTEKSDVYSFGVVLLELITGREAISENMYIVNWVKSMVAQGNIEKIIDPRLHGDFDMNAAWKVLELALTCVDHTSLRRPTMNDVVTDLKSCLKAEKGVHGAKPNIPDRLMSLNFETALPLTIVHAQDDQSGFISIDCGIAKGTNYTDSKTGLNYVSDAGFIDSGVSQSILPTYNSPTLDLQLTTLTSFPQGTRNCYTLRPKQGKGNRYLIRARFHYGNYDFKGQPPQFDLYLGSDHWYTVNFSVSLAVDYEIIHLTSSDYIYVCLLNIGLGNPFISAIELRLLDSSMYATQLQSLILFRRLNFGTSEIVRYADDKYDRIWRTATTSGLVNVQTSGTVSSTTNQVPSKVMSTAYTNPNLTDNIYYRWTATDATQEFFIYLYIAEIETLESNQKREFDIYLNDVYWYASVSPFDHTTTTYYMTSSNSSVNNITLYQTENSTLPPIFNAIELYNPKQLLQQQTEDQDAEAIWSTKSTYGIKKNWQGDPCVPQASVWVGINCSYNDKENPRITSLNLSSSGLSGEIADSLANLTMIRSLDLSYNNLTGNVPKFLASYSSLEILNLTGNKFARPLPSELLQKSKDRSLLLIIEGISNQDKGSCPEDTCKKNKHNKVVIPVIATVAAFFVLITTLSIIWIFRRRQPHGLEYVQYEPGDTIESRNQRFTFLEIQSITNSFNTVIGKGGFGTVFYGSLRDKQVAVKMLSESSAQGYKEFQAEVKLSWNKRLEIGYDAAQGLEYMHHGCKPPLVHRDVKCSNILLNETLQAKLADFGLSRAFATEGATHVSTAIAGTPGYLDPEYYTTNRLTEKSDVYSFGVVLLELITGREAISENMYIVNWVKSMVEQGNVKKIIDPRLHGDFDMNAAWKVLELALTCVDHTSARRPTMNDVVADLKNCLKAEKGVHGANPNISDPFMSLNVESMMGPNLR
ncbi:leucine-rich repeat transmembrane protein kinase protein [Tanacetum coccineum]